MSLNRRFEELQMYEDVFGFFIEIFNHSDEELLTHSKDLHLKLKNDVSGETDIDGLDLFNELRALKLQFSLIKSKEPRNILQYLFSNNLLSTFSNTAIVLRILLTLPVSVASGERSFSKLKIIKNYLRSTITQERLTNLSIVAIEHEILDQLDISQVIQEFANMKARKISFL